MDIGTKDPKSARTRVAAAANDLLRLSTSLMLPLDAVTQTFGLLGKRGAGKTNTAVVMADEMIRAGLPIVIVDPVGVWWGLRSSADGERKGCPSTSWAATTATSRSRRPPAASSPTSSSTRASPSSST